MIKSKKQMFIVIGVFTLVMLLGTVTYAFFNYTRTGSPNTISVGRISFNHTQDDTINLSNVFPIASTDLGTDVGNHGEVTINVTGDTTYQDGLEYLISFSNVNNTINGKKVPIKYTVTPESLGTEATSYWTQRGGSTSYYHILDTDDVREGKYIAVGYIKSGEDGVDGNLVIKAYVDKDEVAITDTPEENSEWQRGRVILTTEEWNSFINTPLSFKVKVEANEGIWVKESPTPATCFTTNVLSEEDHTVEITGYNGGATYTINPNPTQEQITQCATYMGNEWGNEEGDLDEGESWETFCDGTGTYWGDTFQDYVENDWLDDEMYPYFESIGLITKNINPVCGVDVEIPKTINGYTVVKIADGTYSTSPFKNKLINTVEIPNTVTSIGNYAFVSGILTNVIIPNSVTTIGQSAFSYNQLTSVVIPNSVTSIGQYAFSGNQLTSVTIPNSVTSIGEHAFQRNQLTSVTIPNSLTILNAGVFADNKLTNITIPNSVTKIDGNFAGSQSPGEDFVANGAFANNLLTNVTIPSSVLSIGSAAFYHNQLTSVTIPNTVVEIGVGAFNYNNLPDDSAFIYKLTDTNNDGISEIDTTTIVSYGGEKKNVAIPNSVTTIDTNAFSHSKLISVTIPSSVVTIRDSAFSENQLTSVVIPNSVKTIGGGAFYHNVLTNVTIGNGITSINKNAFLKYLSPYVNSSSNPNLASITIDKPCSTIKSMSNYAWIGTSNKAGTTIYGSNNEVCDAF